VHPLSFLFSGGFSWQADLPEQQLIFVSDLTGGAMTELKAITGETKTMQQSKNTYIFENPFTQANIQKSIRIQLSAG